MRLLTIALALLISAVSALAADVAGNWALTIDSPQGQMDVGLTLKQDGDKLTGTLAGPQGDVPITGTIKDNDITLSLDAGGMQISIAAKVDADGKMSGSLDLAGQGEIKFTGTKKAA